MSASKKQSIMVRKWVVGGDRVTIVFVVGLLVSVVFVVGLVVYVVVVGLVEADIVVVTGRSFAFQLQIGRKSLRKFTHRFVIIVAVRC